MRKNLTLERLARAARIIVNTSLYEQITDNINDKSRIFLDSLFDVSVSPDTATTGWAFLKKEIKSPNTTNVRKFIENLDQLDAWKTKAPASIFEFSHRIEQFVDEARHLTVLI